MLNRISALELLVSYTSRSLDGSSAPGLDVDAVQAQFRSASRVPRGAAPAPLVSLLERFKTVSEAFARLKDDHPDIQLLLQHQAAHPAIFAAPASAASAAAPLPASALEPLLLESADDVSAAARALEQLSALTPLLDAPLGGAAGGGLAALTGRIAAAETAVAALAAEAEDAHARVDAAARAYGAAVHAVSAQLLAWSAELDRLEAIIDKLSN